MTVAALSSAIKSLLTRAGVDNPDGDAREILCTVLGCSPSSLILRDGEISEAEAEKAVVMARRRAEGEPIQYVIGTWSFMGRDYRVGKGVLIPRDDTEVVVNEALKLMRSIPRPQMIDLCAGSGIIAITLEQEISGADVYAIEKSEDAYRYLTDNIELNHSAVKPALADIRECADDYADGSFDMIISNPPYICSNEIPKLQSEVQYEPAMALDGGDSGYDFYEIIIEMWSPKLKVGGYIAFEIGEGQFDHIADLLQENGYTEIKCYLDIQGLTRAITAVYQP